MSDAPQFHVIRRGRLKQYVGGEAKNFTPLLLSQAAHLSGELGVNLTLTHREVPVGRFFADLVGHTPDGRGIVVENQFGNSDHTHLGQLMTYAIGRQAQLAIWVMETFLPEHKSVLDALNAMPSSTIKYIAMEASVTLMGEPPIMGLDFRIVCAPEGWKEARREIAKSAPGAVDSSRVEFLRYLLPILATDYSELTELTVEEINAMWSGTSGRDDWWYLTYGEVFRYHVKATDTKLSVGIDIRSRVKDDPRLKEWEQMLRDGKRVLDPLTPDRVVVVEGTRSNTASLEIRRTVRMADRSRWGDHQDWVTAGLKLVRESLVQINRYRADPPVPPVGE